PRLELPLLPLRRRLPSPELLPPRRRQGALRASLRAVPHPAGSTLRFDLPTAASLPFFVSPTVFLRFVLIRPWLPPCSNAPRLAPRECPDDENSYLKAALRPSEKLG